ncbi:hypothetical protein M9H77_20679 [Catharanthus roseus]|uniref:Uncharacterized protein n=1 Tax=Catharanthus roseus TaxID=4058 RepID=A0ACC0AL87_CATRO|nr:hypothetical protein M9H77_20679 [Catharanthus roseus]
MSFHPRKLLNDSFEDDSITKLCEKYCDLIKNPNGFCPIPCISHCYPICSRSLFDEFPPPPPPPYTADHPGRSNKLSLFLTISLSILAAAFLGFLGYTVYKLYTGWYSPRRRQQQQPPSSPPQEEEARLDFLDEDHGPMVDHPIWYIRTIGLEPSIINAITICRYKKGDGLIEGTDCSVCLNEFQEDETLRLLPKCNHAFHINCIDTWLRSHTNCPLCRAGIVINSAILHSPRQSSFNSSRIEESLLQGSENNRESRRVSEDEDFQGVSIEIESEDGSRAQTQNTFKRSDEEDEARRKEDGFQPLRRSISVDSLSALMVSAAAITNAFQVHSSDRILDKKDLEMNEISSKGADDSVQNSSKPSSAGSSSSNGRSSLQKGSSSSSSSSMVMRSLSCSAKVFLSRYSKNSRSSVTLPRSF